ncbi:MFS transporter, DHA1 family, arabinose polymer transporter [Rhodoferax sp. OV413]|uniref:MFS transporter n=1 Tax=Rhodoferax sp. OV413 TaxID=1855285 RepID=UPI00088B48D0|nr:MFS transporter [Rhodoferax sp. OV413]SDP67096.1 MFS transporter, DHA1 family, arabinose polymer transporter [Rhodoferax sp. OV413]
MPLLDHLRTRLPLFALTVGSFGIGSTEFVIMGLLPEVAGDLNVSIPSAGMLVTGYAMGVVVGAPLMAVALSKAPRKGALLTLMAIFMLGNLLCALAPSFGLMMAARVFTAFAHAAFFGMGAVVAADLVPRDQRAQAMALMFAGLTLANVLGVPGGTALGQALGWRYTFGVVAAIGLVALVGLAALLPRMAAVPGPGLAQEFRMLRDPRVLLGMALSGVSAASLFSVFTYIRPILSGVTQVSDDGVSLFLLLFGVGLTVGNLLGGRLADRRPLRMLVAIFFLLTLVLAGFTLTSAYWGPALLTLFVWGVISFAAVPALQIRVMDAAHGSPTLASTLNQGGFNIGCAGGAYLGGLAIQSGVSYAQLPWVGAALALLAFGMTFIARAQDRKHGRQAGAARDAAAFAH